jgi:hypothetical protein
MRRVLVLTALALTAFASMALGQELYRVEVYDPPLMLDTPDSVRVEAMRFYMNGMPERIVVSVPTLTYADQDGRHTVARHAFSFDLDCNAYKMLLVAWAKVDTAGLWSEPYGPPPAYLVPFRPDPLSSFDVVFRYGCRQGAGRRQAS